MGISVVKIYAEYFANFLTAGLFISFQKVSSVAIKPVFDKIITKSGYKKVWCIGAVPVTFNKNLSQIFRQELTNCCPGAKVVINMKIIPCDDSHDNDKFRRAMYSAEKTYTIYKQVFDELEPSKRITGTVIRNPDNGAKVVVNEQLVKTHEFKYRSFEYVYTQSTSGMCFGYVYYFVECTVSKVKRLQTVTNRVKSIVSELNLFSYEIYGNLSQYLNNFGPAGYFEGNIEGSNHMLFSSENMASFSPFTTKGLVGGHGVIFGLSYGSRLPVAFSFTEGRTAQVAIIVALAGHGKTFLALSMIFSMLSLMHHVNVMDWKGGEYDRALEFANSIKINMSDTNPSFVNTLRLDDLSMLDIELAKELFDYAISGTIAAFSIMTNLQSGEGNPQDLEAILNDAVVKLYAKEDVSPTHIESFRKTKDWKLSMLLPVILDLASSKSYTPQKQALCKLVVDRCNMFLGDGLYSSMFDNEITLRNVIDKELVIYDFNKNEDARDFGPIESLKIFMMSFLNNKKAVVLRRVGLFTDDIYEEFQRTRNNAPVCKYISEKVTGSRSDNKNVWLLFNTLSAFQHVGNITDNYVDAIRSNVTTGIFGYMNENDIQAVPELFGYKFNDIQHYIEQINRNNEELHNYFAIHAETGVTLDRDIFKAELPDFITEKMHTRSVSS